MNSRRPVSLWEVICCINCLAVCAFAKMLQIGPQTNYRKEDAGSDTNRRNTRVDSRTNRSISSVEDSNLSGETMQAAYFSDLSHLLNGYGSHQCYAIPKNLTLCNDVGYDKMVLPNSLEHVKIDEVIHQSEGWIRLVYSGCHAETSRFLCAIYAPVCIKDHPEKLIPPCRELCESVRDSCLPIMSDFGLGWPDMVTCSKFPLGPANLCIPSNKQKKNRCVGCVDLPKYESAVGVYCSSDIVLKTRFVKLIPLANTANESKILHLSERPTVIKKNPRIHSPSKLIYRMDCDCPILNADISHPKGSGRWILMGKLSTDGTFVQVQHLSLLSGKNVALKRALRSIRKYSSSICQVNNLRLLYSRETQLERGSVPPPVDAKRSRRPRQDSAGLDQALSTNQQSQWQSGGHGGKPREMWKKEATQKQFESRKHDGNFDENRESVHATSSYVTSGHRMNLEQDRHRMNQIEVKNPGSNI